MNIQTQLNSKTQSQKGWRVVGVFNEEKERISSATTLSKTTLNDAKKELALRGFEGSLKEIVSCYSADGVILFVGLGSKKKYSLESARRATAAIYQKARSEKITTLIFDLDSFALRQDGEYAGAIAESLLLIDYSFDAHKAKPKKPKKTIKTVTLSAKNAGLVKKGQKSVDEAIIVAQGVNLARDVANEPANLLYPDSYAKRMQKESTRSKIKCTIMKEAELEKKGMGGIIGVGKGSVKKPRLVIMEYKPSKKKNKKPIVLVGKGVTFDTGGISIKPSPKMDEMKFDMCGSAAVFGAISAIANLKLPVHVVALTPLAENMPGGNAQRPGDVIKCYNGKTVEVLNTDAEGRLILADALAYSKKFDPLCVVDTATLTGACAYTLDYAGSGVMTTDEKLVKKLKNAGDKAGERLWEFPLWEEYGEFIKGTYADIQNISRKTAGIQTSGWFLKHFAEHAPWAHIDIAGTAWGAPRDYYPAGATGVGVRLFVNFVKGYASR